MIPTQKLDLWIKHGKNVAFFGRHGVGKTSIILDAWKRHGLRHLYFSAANMDPWIDLVGVPKESNAQPKEFQLIHYLMGMDRNLAIEWVENNWKMSSESAEQVVAHISKTGAMPAYLDLIRPKALALDEVDAIFFDEYNRAPEKVRNATMQFIQFKEVNGKRFDNLKMIWIACNPSESGEYDVQELDPAQQDRFHVHVEIPFRPLPEYFNQKYGKAGQKFCDWWTKLPQEIKNNISPRRLDYAADMWSIGGDMEDVLPANTNIAELKSVLDKGTIEERVEVLLKNPKTTAEDKRKFLENENNWYHLKPKFSEKTPEAKQLFQEFAPFFEPEKAFALCSDNMKLFDQFVENAGHNPEIVEDFKTRHDKKTVIPTLLAGIVIRELGYKDAAVAMNDVNKQKAMMDAVKSKLDNGAIGPNQVYASAWVLQNALTNWPDLAKQSYVKDYQDAVRKALANHPKIHQVFKAVI
jgi:hypothetical protein